jgi:hypothetical protein
VSVIFEKLVHCRGFGLTHFGFRGSLSANARLDSLYDPLELAVGNRTKNPDAKTEIIDLTLRISRDTTGAVRIHRKFVNKNRITWHIVPLARWPWSLT